MRRERTLFDAGDPCVYLVDTSAWLNIDLRPDSDACWSLVYKLIKDRRIIACRRVLMELKPRGLFDNKLADFEETLVDGCRDTGTADIDYLRKVGEITRRFPGMSRPRSRKTPADPYVVALAYMDGYTVVVDETMTNRPTRKIPTACDALKIPWMPLSRFIATERK